MNTQALLDMVKINEAVPDADFSMSRWAEKTPCGTVACLVGNYVLNKKIGLSHWNSCSVMESLSIDLPVLIEHLGITHNEFYWLFLPMPNELTPRLDNISKERAIGRLRKFIYYKLHKAEMSYEEQRRTGHYNFVAKTLETISNS